MENSKKVKDNLISFLKRHSVIAVATQGEENPWISNFYYVVSDDFKIYFLTLRDNKYSRNALKNKKVAFNVYEHGSDLFADRRSVQGVGFSRLITNGEKEEAIELLSDIAPKRFLERDNKEKIGFWVIEPYFIKYLDDKYFKENEFVGLDIKYEKTDK